MRKRVSFHDKALAELVAQAVYYESKSSGLGERFANEIEAATAIAAEFPSMGAPFKYGTRRVFPKKFPFSVIYQIRNEDIVILAVAADARKPSYWRDRQRDS